MYYFILGLGDMVAQVKVDLPVNINMRLLDFLLHNCYISSQTSYWQSRSFKTVMSKTNSLQQLFMAPNIGSRTW